jgi:hypothetical protein
MPFMNHDIHQIIIIIDLKVTPFDQNILWMSKNPNFILNRKSFLKNKNRMIKDTDKHKSN